MPAAAPPKAKPAPAKSPSPPAAVEGQARGEGALSAAKPPASQPISPASAGGEGAKSSASTDAGKPSSPPINFGADTVMPDKVPYASPAVRVFARELGVDLSKVTGSERGGRIIKEDVQKFIKAALAGGGAAAGGAVAAGGGLNLLPWPKVDFSKFGEVETKPLSRIQKI